MTRTALKGKIRMLVSGRRDVATTGMGRREPDRGAADRGRAATVYWILGMGLAVGLAAYVGGYLISGRRQRSFLDWSTTCSIRSVGHSGPESSWSCSSRSSPRRSGVNTSGRSMLMRQLSAKEVGRPKPPPKHRPIDSRRCGQPIGDKALGSYGGPDLETADGGRQSKLL